MRKLLFIGAVWLQLSYPAAGASESVHLKELFRQDVSQFAN
jgi:hypothetical protein